MAVIAAAGLVIYSLTSYIKLMMVGHKGNVPNNILEIFRKINFIIAGKVCTYFVVFFNEEAGEVITLWCGKIHLIAK